MLLNRNISVCIHIKYMCRHISIEYVMILYCSWIYMHRYTNNYNYSPVIYISGCIR